MERLDTLRRDMGDLMEKLDPAARQKAFIHTHGVAGLCALLCARRGLSTETGYLCGLLHDAAFYCYGTYDGHCQKGAALAQSMLAQTGLFDADTITLVMAAIANHDFIDQMHGPYDEALKDADVFAPYLSGALLTVRDHAAARIAKVRAELGLPA